MRVGCFSSYRFGIGSVLESGCRRGDLGVEQGIDI